MNSVEMNMAKQAILDKLEARIKTAEAKLDTLKARAVDSESEHRDQSNHRAANQEADDPAEAAGAEELGRGPVGAGKGRSRCPDRRLREVGKSDRIEGKDQGKLRRTCGQSNAIHSWSFIETRLRTVSFLAEPGQRKEN